MRDETTLAVPVYVRELRKRAKITQEELAERSGLSTGSISNLETGRNGFTDKSLAAVALALGCQPVDLLTSPERRADKVSGEDEIVALLRKIDGLPEEAVKIIWRIIGGYLEEAGQLKQSPRHDQPASSMRRREEPTSR